MDTQQARAASQRADARPAETADLAKALAEPIEVAEAEADEGLVERYPPLVRLAYVTLPAGLGRHRRVLLAHQLAHQLAQRLAQRTLPRSRSTAPEGVSPPDPAYAPLRRQVLRGAAAYGWSLAGCRRHTRAALVAAALPPPVVGLRPSPRAGGTDELTLDRALAHFDAPAQAVHALRALAELSARDAAELLALAGVGEPLKVVAEASAAGSIGNAQLLASPKFDPRIVQARPTDLMHRRPHVRAASAAAATAAIALVLLGVPDSGGAGFGSAGTPSSRQSAVSQALDPTKVARAAPDAWMRSARLDLSAWPARGDRTGPTVHPCATVGAPDGRLDTPRADLTAADRRPLHHSGAHSGALRTGVLSGGARDSDSRRCGDRDTAIQWSVLADPRPGPRLRPSDAVAPHPFGGIHS